MARKMLEGQVLAFGKEIRDEMNLLGNEFGSETIATSDILSARGINVTYSTLVKPSCLHWSLHTAFLVHAHSARLMTKLFQPIKIDVDRNNRSSPLGS